MRTIHKMKQFNKNIEDEIENMEDKVKRQPSQSQFLHLISKIGQTSNQNRARFKFRNKLNLKTNK